MVTLPCRLCGREYARTSCSCRGRCDFVHLIGSHQICLYLLVSDVKDPGTVLQSHDAVSGGVNTKDKEPVDNHVIHPPANQLTSSPAYDQPLFTSSSEGQASLQEIWKILDEEESFQSPTPSKARSSSPQRSTFLRNLGPDYIPTRDSPERDVFALKGRRTEVQTRPAKQKPGLSKKAAGKAKLTPKKLEVRNYNIRDDG